MGSNPAFEEGVPKQGLILALDIGTTTVRCHLYDQDGVIRGSGDRKIEVIHPKPGLAEMDEENLWQQVQEIIKDAIQDAGVSPQDILCMGITTQRNTFITWDKETGRPFHRFITWQDLRASDTVKAWNDSYMLKAFNNGARLLHIMTRKKRFLAASVLKFKSAQVTLRLKWAIENIPELKKRVQEKQVLYGCIETWLLWKLTGGLVHATDYSCASSTGLFDPFQMEWSSIVAGLVKLPMHIYPKVKDTGGAFGVCSPELFGAEIPITSIVADQQSAMFAQCCFKEGDVNATMGTGTFVDTNTGSRPHASVAGLYPLVGWKIGPELVYIAEGYASDTGMCVEWAKKLGLFDDVQEIEELLTSVDDSGGAYFVPAFSGMQAPINDDKACSSLIGITYKTSKAHILRAIMESLAFRFKLLYETILNETRTNLAPVCRMDGGVSNSNFLMELVASLINCEIIRSDNTDMTSLGAAFIAGLAIGLWQSKDELKMLHKKERVFRPKPATLTKYKPVIGEWKQAVSRSMCWYSDVHV